MGLMRQLCFLFLGTVLCAGETQTPTIDQSLSAKQAIGVAISPDGRYVAYVVQQANWEENSFDTQIWIAQPATGERYQLTSGKKSSQSPKWSPDSKRIAFASDRDGKRQIYLISPSGGEAAQLTAEENGVEAFAWSPDGARIAFTSTGPDSKTKKDRKDKYGEFEIVNGDYSMNHIWLIQATGEVPVEAKEKPKPEALTQAIDSAWAISRGRRIPSASRSARLAIPTSAPRRPRTSTS
jgi:dipeptidyl aminopeptidase/acylaminoacyl peptidase